MRVLEPQQVTASEAARPLRLGARDAAATALGAFASVVFFATMRGWGAPVIGSYRSAIGVLAGIGLVMCVVGAKDIPPLPAAGPMVKSAATLGFLAMGLTVMGLVSPSVTIFVALGVTMFLLWAITTVRHALDLR